MPNKALVVDANILVRAVLGKRVRGVIEAYAEDIFFVLRVPPLEAEARERLATRDTDDWPILASALALACPI